MEYLASGALSRAHFALVNDVEQAQSPQQADIRLVAEIQRVRDKLSRRQALSPGTCYEYLVLLLYCVTASTISPTNRDVAFAIPHAVNLAEAGDTLRQRRTGYIFCATVMQPGDELMLMLVNTIRKDLESKEAPRISAGLDALISLPHEADIVPAVQDSLVTLIGHNSPTIRQRALHAARLLQVSKSKPLLAALTLRLNEAHEPVVQAALLLAEDLNQRGMFPSEELGRSACDILRLRVPGQINSGVVRAALKTIRATLRDTLSEGLVDDMLHTILEVVQLTCKAATDTLHPTVLESFRTLGAFTVPALARALHNVGHPLHKIRHLLMAQDATSHYSFLACLRELHPDLWAGTGEHPLPPVLDELDVQSVMRLLDAEDAAIRRATYDVLFAVDPQILQGFAENLESQLKLGDERSALRIFEVSRVLDPDGEAYAQRVGLVLARIETANKGKGPASPALSSSSRASKSRRPQVVLEQVVEFILGHLKDRGPDFAAIFTTTMLHGALLGPGTPSGPTLMLVMAASACEYLTKTPLNPRDVVVAMAASLHLNPLSIQEALLIAMLRIVAECDTVPGEAARDVKELAVHAGRHIRRRCGQFLSLSTDLPTLRSKVASAKSSSLPDFLMAIESTPSILSPTDSPQVTTPKAVVSPRSPAKDLPKTTSKLRYSAYEPPPVAISKQALPKRNLSSNSSLSSVSESSDAARKRVQVQSVQDVDDLLSRTLTAGDLVLAAQDLNLNLNHGTGYGSGTPQPNLGKIVERQASKSSIGSLDSPFYTEPPIDPIDPFGINTSPNPLNSSSDSSSNPFHSDPPSESSEPAVDPFTAAPAAEPISISDGSFEQLWTSITGPKTSGRGWCESGVVDVFEHLAGQKQFELRRVLPEEEPDQGRIRVAFCVNAKDVAALRLRTGDDGVCLWSLRCTTQELKVRIESALDV